MYLVKKGVQIATRPTWAFQGVPTKGGAFWWKQPSSPGRAGRQPPPSFPYNRGRRVEQKCSTLLVSENHLKLVRKIVSVKKIQAEALPRRFRGRFREDFPPFFIVLRSFFVVLRSSTGKFLKSNLSIHSMCP